MAEIILNNGAIALVDEFDMDALAAVRWFWSNGYASHQERRDGHPHTVYMHRLLMGEPAGLEVDHINADGLDNRRANLRIVTRSQNEQAKHRVRSDSTTGVRGVERIHGGRYRARIWLDGKAIPLGCFRTIEEAAVAASEGRRRFFTHAPESEVA